MDKYIRMFLKDYKEGQITNIEDKINRNDFEPEELKAIFDPRLNPIWAEINQSSIHIETIIWLKKLAILKQDMSYYDSIIRDITYIFERLESRVETIIQNVKQNNSKEQTTIILHNAGIFENYKKLENNNIKKDIITMKLLLEKAFINSNTHIIWKEKEVSVEFGNALLYNLMITA